MTLHLEPVAETGSEAPPPEGDAYASFVDTQGRLARLHPQPDGSLTLALQTGRGTQARTFDRFQAAALKAAFESMADG